MSRKWNELSKREKCVAINLRTKEIINLTAEGCKLMLNENEIQKIRKLRELYKLETYDFISEKIKRDITLHKSIKEYAKQDCMGYNYSGTNKGITANWTL